VVRVDCLPGVPIGWLYDVHVDSSGTR
jgi:hypothetical protein